MRKNTQINRLELILPTFSKISISLSLNNGRFEQYNKIISFSTSQAV